MLQLLAIIGVQIIIAGYFIYFVTRNDRGQKEPKSGIAVAIGLGLLAVVLVSAITTLIKSLPGLSELTGLTNTTATKVDFNTTHLVLAALLIGVIEETAKALPLALYIYKKPYFNELTDGVLYFGTTGIIFGLAETILYTIMLGSEVGLIRIVITPFLHAGFSMWFGIALARYKLELSGLSLVMLAFIGSMLIHGIYNFGLLTDNPTLVMSSLLIALGLNLGVFVMYRQTQKIDLKLIAAGLEDGEDTTREGLEESQ